MNKLAGAAWLIAAVLAVAGSFLPFLEMRFSAQTRAYTAWYGGAYEMTRLIGAGAWIVAAGLAVAGSLATQVTSRYRSGDTTVIVPRMQQKG
jgi:hypothetical protein